MIISKTPLRISFLGGGTDYPSYFKKFGGETLATSIDKYTIITLNRLTQFVDYKIRVHYSVVESVKSIEEIRHPSARECLRFMGIKEGIEIHYINDLPARTGLGSSSSATVGLLTALHAFKGEKINKEKIAEEAVFVEQQLIKENVGCQDQYVCALGGLLYLKFLTTSKVEVRTLQLDPKRIIAFKERLILVYTGVQRDAQSVVTEQIQKTESGENNERLLKLKELVHRGLKVLEGKGKINDFGEILHESWLIKRSLSSKISNELIDGAYKSALKAGAIGGKLLGAGGGGFLLLFAEPKNHRKILEVLPFFKRAYFSFDRDGTHIIFNE